MSFSNAMDLDKKQDDSAKIEIVLQQLKSLQTQNQTKSLLSSLRGRSDTITNYLDLLPADVLRSTAHYYVREKERIKESCLKIPHGLKNYQADCYCSSCSGEHRRRREAWDAWKKDLCQTGYNIGYYGSLTLLAGGCLTVILSLKPEEQNIVADKMFEASVDLLKKTVEEAAKGPVYVSQAASAPIARQVVDRAMEEAHRVLPILRQRGVGISLEAVYAMIKSGIDPLRYYGQQAVTSFMGRR